MLNSFIPKNNKLTFQKQNQYIVNINFGTYKNRRISIDIKNNLKNIILSDIHSLFNFFNIVFTSVIYVLFYFSLSDKFNIPINYYLFTFTYSKLVSNWLLLIPLFLIIVNILLFTIFMKVKNVLINQYISYSFLFSIYILNFLISLSMYRYLMSIGD